MNRETKKALTRQAIIDAAHQHLLHDGFRATDMKTIAKTAGISVVTLYKYFDSKESLTIAVGQKLITDNINHRIAILQRDDLDFVGKMKLYMHYEIHNDDDLPRDLKKFLANSFPARAELIATYEEKSDDLWATLIPAGRASGYIPDHISDDALKLYTEIFINHFQNGQDTTRPMSPELENEIGYLFFFGLMGANLNEDEIL
jgi:AcrR family transcriptional regulator